MFKSLILVFAFLVVLSLNAGAQARIIYGHVSVFDSIPLVGVRIMVKSSKHVVETDSLGNFWARCNAKDKLKASVAGFADNTIKVSADDKVIHFKMKLKDGTKNFELALEHVHTAYVDRLNKIVNNEDADFSNYTNIYDLIVGRLAGVRIENGEFLMRGTRSMTGSNAALIVLDGVPVDYGTLSSISPTDVKSVAVLAGTKAAYFGSEGANGVIAIETKRGGN
jgi:hypothetical protein